MVKNAGMPDPMDDCPDSWRVLSYKADYVKEFKLRDGAADHLNIHWIKAAKGRGKTTAIMKALEEYKNHKKVLPRVLALSTLRAVAHKFSEDYELECYLDEMSVKPDLHKKARLVISPQSLHKLCMDHDQSKWPTFDILILDEYDAILRSLDNPVTHKVPILHTQKALQWLMATANHVIISDADLNSWHKKHTEMMLEQGFNMFCLHKTIVDHVQWNTLTLDNAEYYINSKDEMERRLAWAMHNKDLTTDNVAILASTRKDARRGLVHALNACPFFAKRIEEIQSALHTLGVWYLTKEDEDAKLLALFTSLERRLTQAVSWR